MKRRTTKRRLAGFHPSSFILHPSNDPAGAGLQAAGDGMMWLDDRFQAQLQQAGMTRFEAVMEHRGGLCLRVLDDRENWYFAPQGETAAVGVYLKNIACGRGRACCGRNSAPAAASRPHGPKPGAPARSLCWAST